MCGVWLTCRICRFHVGHDGGADNCAPSVGSVWMGRWGQTRRRVSLASAALLACTHAGGRVQVFVYCVTPRRDAKSAYMRADAEAAGCTWRSVAAAGERALADLIRRDGVDVLIELTGHTAHNRLGVMRYRAAPVQMTWIGYPNSTGLAEVDYRITDAASDPADTAQTYVEQLLRLPGCFLCYTPMRQPPEVAAAPCLQHGYVTFGSFNALAKVTDEVIDVRPPPSPLTELSMNHTSGACSCGAVLWQRALLSQGTGSMHGALGGGVDEGM